MATAEEIKKLREMTSCGVIECKKALEEANGDFDAAKKVLQKRGLELAAKKGGRVAKEGRVETYIHLGSKLGVLLEMNCETDFVARNESFCALTKNIAMHIAAANPRYIKREDVPADELKAQADPEGYIKTVCLLEQAYIRDPQKTITDCINELIASSGENMFVGRFARYKVGE
jgi:elongation factor Ts